MEQKGAETVELKSCFHRVSMSFSSTVSLFTHKHIQTHTTALYSLTHPLAHRNTEPLHPTHVTKVIEWEATAEQKERGERKNDGVCLCQGLMRRVMPWIGCSLSSPWIPLLLSGLVMCDVERLSLEGHYSALSYTVHNSTHSLHPSSESQTLTLHCITNFRSHLILC